MILRDDRLVVRELPLDQPSRHDEVRHLEHELVVRDSDLHVLARAQHALDLVHRLARHDPARAAHPGAETPRRDREPVAVGRHQTNVLPLEGEEHAI